MALKPTPWTGYMNFSPDLVSSDLAEPRAQSLGQQEASRIQRSKIGAQNTRKLQVAERKYLAAKYKLEKPRNK